jgi:hypothetical protein
MPRCAFVLVCVAVLFVSARAAESAGSFSQTLTAEQKQRLGLANLTPTQLAELDAAVAAYTRGEATAAVQQAVKQAEQQTEKKVQEAQKKAAATAVAEYKKKEEPGLVARALDTFKRKQEESQRQRFTARVVGEFRGWSGGTYFPLENGEIWRQVGSETNELPPTKAAEVEIYQSSSGYWRLKYQGAWITVKRLQ